MKKESAIVPMVDAVASTKEQKIATNEWSTLAKVVYGRTYSREMENGALETWEDTVKRVIEGNIGKYRGTDALEKDEEEKLLYYMLNRKASPAGRGLWFSGTEAQKNLGGAGLNNCYHFTADDYENFAIAQDYLMLGGGVGMSVEHKYVSKLPRIKKNVVITNKETSDADYIVPDSREGWVRLTKKVLKSFFETGESFSYSCVVVRGAGEAIKTFGGKASGKLPLIEYVTKLCALLKSREGRMIRPIDAADIICSIGEMVVSGNVRRSAILIQGDAWDKEYLKAKRWDLGNIPTQRAMANFSIVCEDIDDVHKSFWETYKQGEPFGIINLANMQKYGRMGELKKDPTVTGTNPCITGDTVVAVADGSGNKTIKELSIEGEDVYVYCLDGEGKLQIRTMRNPRVTGYNQKIYKLLLDDGSSVRATANHKFRLKSGEYRRMDELVAGDSLELLTKSIKTLDKSNSKNSSYYILLSKSINGSNVEHRAIYENYYGITIPKGYVIHHKDFNSENNRIDNLLMMTKKDHDELLRSGMIGDKNPMRRARTEWSEEKWDNYRAKHSKLSTGNNNSNFRGLSNKEVYKIALKLTRTLGRRFSYLEWAEDCQKSGAPTQFSKFRQKEFGNITSLAKTCALELGFEYTDADPRTLRNYKNALEQGYDAHIADSSVYVTKFCEKCFEDFVCSYGRRETGFCSPCSIILNNTNLENIAKRTASKKIINEEKHVTLREEQAKVFSDLKFSIKREPQKIEWMAECRKLGVSPEISRTSSPFRSFNALKEAASNYNHKVVSVEFCGYEDVYNGTVDEFHNFFIGNFDFETDTGKAKSFYINTLNCGEIQLSPFESCNLSEVYLPNLEGTEEFEEAARLMYRYCKRVACEDYHQPKTDAVVKRNRRTGVGITGCLESPLFVPEILDKTYKIIEAEDKKYSKTLGVPESIRLTTIKPSGTTSLVGDTTAGIHPAYSKYYVRRVRFASNDKLIPHLKAAGHFIEPVRRFDGTSDSKTQVVEFVCKSSEGTPVADESWTMEKQLDVLKMVQKHWSDNSVSVTVYYDDSSLDTIKEWLKNNLAEIKTISFLKHTGHGFDQAPYEAITEEQFIEKSKNLKELDFDVIAKSFEKEMLDMEDCAGGVCPIR